MDIKLSINNDSCTRCGRCVQVCPANIFVTGDKGSTPEVVGEENCIGCGHCVAACGSSSVCHSLFPAYKVHSVDHAQLPTPEQVMLLCQTRRSNRAFSDKPVPREKLEAVVEAARRAPTASNGQELAFTVITDPEKLKLIIEFTLDVFGGMVRKFKNPLLRPLVCMAVPGAKRYAAVFERMVDDYYNHGGDGVLRKATAVVFVHVPKGSRFGTIDANLAYQNGSLMAESMGVSQFYTGFVLNAVNTRPGKLEALLGIDGKIEAGMGLGMPKFRFPQYIDRKDTPVDWK